MQKFRDQRVALVGLASTQSLQAAARTLKDTPTVFSCVIDPVAAGGAETADRAKPNVTGVFNPFPVAEGVRMVHEMLPEVRTIGTLYDPGEPFSERMQAVAQQTSEELGLRWVAIPVAGVNDIVPGVQALKARGVGAMLQLPSNTVNQALDAQVAEGRKLGLPMFSLQPDQLEKGVVAAVGIDFRKAGEEAGRLAAEILKGKKPNDVPMQQATVEPVRVNEDAARAVGIGR
jgi:putative tryptophan/tyrosine transport system substrate-binding protein